MKRIAILGSGTPCATGAPAHLAAMTPAGVELVPWPLPISAFPYTPFDHVLVAASHAAAAAEAVASGVDALYIDTFGDYAIDAMRALGDVPVIGAGEATLHAAALVARRFSIVTVWPHSMRYIYDGRVAASGLAARCVSIRHLGEPVEVMARLQGEDTDVTARIAQACRDAIEHDGAEAIALGCTCMAPVHAAVAAAVDAPVLCCSRTGHAMAIAALFGDWSSSALAYPRVPRQRVEHLLALTSGADSARGGDDGACPVCPVSPGG
jgi:allantoin racemase